MNTSQASTPDPLREVPPADQFCDVVLNGGVASGVVYPWALLKLARHYRFKCIGGNSVGAMAAAMAAAAEYGRCHGVEDAFEPLRRMPLKLAETEGGKTKMLRLFQPSAPVRRLFDLFLIAVLPSEARNGVAPGAMPALMSALRLYGFWLPLAVLVVLTIWVLAQSKAGFVAGAVLFILGVAGAIGLALLIVAWRFYRDLGALANNAYGLCTGRGQTSGDEGLVEWLHQGIQRSAGRGRDDPPLTFADLWSAPRFGQAGPAPLPEGLQPPNPGINLQMFTSNITQGRPVRLPLNDANTRLYYHPAQWQAYFPPSILRALHQASSPYRPASTSDPDPAAPSEDQRQLMDELRELPSGGMPIVVAARLSLCFPLLFSCVPVYAVDYEAPEGQRRMGRCLLSDGGLCTNFPVHLFDAAHPRWPTFALMLDRQLRNYQGQQRWLPKTNLEGRADNWLRFVPGAEDEGTQQRPLLARLLGFAGGMVLTMKDWNDRVTGRLPHVRNRIIRLQLKSGEDQLNLAMPAATILHMAHEYGTKAGEDLVAAFAPDCSGIKPAWREHLYVRSMVELRALRRHLRGYSLAVNSLGTTQPLRDVLNAATQHRPLAERPGRSDPGGAPLSTAQRQALDRAIQAVQALEAELSACEGQFGPYRPVLEPELRLRSPL